MKYTIVYKEAENKYEMNGVLADFIGDHFRVIAEEHSVKDLCSYEAYSMWYSESYMLACLYDKGLQIDLLEEDGSRMAW